MGLVKLPSGKSAKVPDNLTEEQVLNLLFENLPEGEDKDRIGDRLETSGWGATIGGTIGSIGGAIAGLPFGGVGAIPGSIVGGAGGAAVGEGIEQWITGKGDWSDIGWSGAEGGAWGLLPGAGATVGKAAAKAGAKKLGQTTANLGTQALGGAGIGGTGAFVTGQDPTTGAAIGAGAGALGVGKGLGKVGDKFAKTKFGQGLLERGGEVVSGIGRTVGVGASKGTLSEGVADGIEKIVTGEIKAAIGRPTGKFQSTEGKLDIRRALVAAAWDAFRGKFKRTPNKAEKEFIDETIKRQLREDKLDYQDFHSAQLDMFDAAGNPIEIAPGSTKYYKQGGKVSNKIGLLRREGYPQDQAVAIAHSYKRKGLLG